ncbi:MAG: hypothetical protein K5770_16570 [Lachnospiraceae bacterium]|nr:hypothetical protein [Lachnospiraceae bacterium]
MIITLIVFILMAFVFCATGFTAGRVTKKLFGCSIKSMDGLIMAGIMISSVYAEVFSLFYGVSFLALFLLIMFSIVACFFFRREISVFFRDFLNRQGSSSIIAAFIIFIAISAISACEPLDYDTYLYHGQMIKWIEEYGAVRGLANLHMRFGYNSAFMCLQALFSLSFTGRSFHQVNGFICAFMLLYACSDNSFFRPSFRMIGELKLPGAGNFRGKRSSASDLIKLSMIFYIVYCIDSISSSGSDIFPMLTLLYIFSRWAEITEETEPSDKAVRYGLLCMLSVFVITAKLSAAPVVLLSVYPVYLLLSPAKKSRESVMGRSSDKEKNKVYSTNKDAHVADDTENVRGLAGNGKPRIKSLVLFILIAVFTGLPFIIRNIIISGYLLYPMEKIDLFDVDWKVPGEIAATDRFEIAAYAKAMQNMEELSGSLRIWLQVWFRELGLVERIFFFISVFMIALIMVNVIKQAFEKRLDERALLCIVGILSYLYWFIMAPNMRYGIVNLFLVSALALGYYAEEPAHTAFYALLLICGIGMLPLKQDILYTRTNLIYPDDYKRYECTETIISSPSGNEIVIYVPKDGDQSGIDVFPESPTADGRYLMLRGESLKEGFRAIGEN